MNAARNAVTVVHEMGHVGAALLSGRRVQGIRLHTDISGLAITRSSPRGTGMLLTALAGYPAPGVVGAGSVWAATPGHTGAALMLLLAVLVVALLLVRDLWGLLIVLGSLMGAGMVLWRGAGGTFPLDGLVGALRTGHCGLRRDGAADGRRRAAAAPGLTFAP
jgi:Peptidase M50B-like